MSIFSRAFFGQLDLHGTPYHSVGLLKTYIRLARYYKLNVLTFNLGPSLWRVIITHSTDIQLPHLILTQSSPNHHHPIIT